MKEMQEYTVTHAVLKFKEVLDAAAKKPVKLVTGSSRWAKRKPLVLLSEERYLALVEDGVMTKVKLQRVLVEAKLANSKNRK